MSNTKLLSPFVAGYLKCLLWSSTDESTPSGGDPLDKNYDLTDIAPESVTKAVAECQAFQAANAHLLDVCGLPEESQGHYFWLNRNGHGTGFWDRCTEEEVGQLLSDACAPLGERNAYIGDDGQIHIG